MQIPDILDQTGGGNQYLQEALEYRTNLDTLRNALKTKKKHTYNQEIIAATLAQTIQPNSICGQAQQMPDSEKLGGSPNQIKPFEGKLCLKVSDRDSFSNKQAKHRYTISLLMGKALDSVSHLIQPSGA